jgi:ribonuclease T1
MPLMPQNSDSIELQALRQSGLVGRLGRSDCDVYAFEFDLLPIEAKRVVQLIIDGAPLYYPKHDGNIFKNRAGDLPSKAIYREFTVPTPNTKNRGKRRLVIRENGLTFFTACHYDRIGTAGDLETWKAELAKLDPQWRYGFYVVTGMSAQTRRSIADGIKKIQDSRLPAVIR